MGSVKDKVKGTMWKFPERFQVLLKVKNPL